MNEREINNMKNESIPLRPRKRSYVNERRYSYSRPRTSTSTKGFKRMLLFFIMFISVYLISNNISDINTTYEIPEISIVEEVAEQGYDLSIPYMAEITALIFENPNAVTIADNIWKYPSELLELAIRNNETVDFVADYLNFRNKTSVSHHEIDLSEEVSQGIIPHFVQWDKRWGYSYYGSEIMGIDGCGPTSLAMVAAGLTGKAEYNPRYVADYSQDKNYITADAQTTWTLMSVGSRDFGLEPTELILDSNAIINALKRGEPIIASMGPGDFTTGGHFIVLTGVTSDGKITIRDSNSYKNTNTTWDVQRLMSQMKNLWAFKVK